MSSNSGGFASTNGKDGRKLSGRGGAFGAGCRTWTRSGAGTGVLELVFGTGVWSRSYGRGLGVRAGTHLHTQTPSELSLRDEPVREDALVDLVHSRCLVFAPEAFTQLFPL